MALNQQAVAEQAADEPGQLDAIGQAEVTNQRLDPAAIRPLFERLDRYAYVLCRTSNPGAAEVQGLTVAAREGSGGTPAAPSNVMAAVLKSNDGKVLEQWDGTALSNLPTSAVTNEFAYNRFAPGPFGLRAEMGAMATITLPALSSAATGRLQSAATLQLRTVNGNTFDVAVRAG